MQGLIRFMFLVLMLQTGTIFAQKILKVQGNKVVISTRGLDVSEGDVLTITSDGFEAGKVKILSVSSKTAVGKITEGSALKGDSVKGGGSKRSSKSDDEEDEDYGSSKKSKKSKSSRSSKGSGFGAHVGFSYAMLSNIASQQGDYAQDGQTGIFLMGEYRTGKSIYHFGLRNTSGGATFTPKQAGLNITNIEISTTNIFGRISNPINRNAYFTYGGQFSMVSVEDNMNTGLVSGAHTLDLKGLGGIGGVGYDFLLGSFVLKAEGLFEINYYFMNSSKVPGNASEFDTGAFMTYGLHLNFSVGYKF
jgi:hypothetical protein